MYQKYSIGTMAHLMGISAEALRYYESKNIVSPIRDPETGYRYFNTWDFHMLLRARHYQNYGFSLEEIGELFRSGELSQVREKMEDQEVVIEKEIIRQTNLLKRIRQSQSMLKDAMDSVGKFRIEERPGIYRMNTQKKYTLFKEKEQLDLISEWSEKEPFVFSCAVFYEKDIRDGNSPCLCVHTCVPSRSSKYLSLDNLADGLEFLRQNGLTLCGDVVTQVVCMTKPEEEYFNWHLVWFPIASPY